MIRNTTTSYGWLSITLHWLMALGVIGLFGLGLYMVDLSYYDSWYRGSLDLHKSVGICLAGIWLLRVIWRSTGPSPMPLSNKPSDIALARWAHRLLYLGLLALMLTGYLISTADGRSISVFGLVDMPALPWALEQQEDIAGDAHYVLAWGLIGLTTLHALAALKHHFVDKDNTLKRMLRP